MACEYSAARSAWRRSAYYAAPKKAERPRARENARLGAKARELFEASGRTYGSPRLAVALRRAGQPCGRHRVARLMRRAGLRARQKRRFRPCTTDSHHLCRIAPNRLADQAEPPARPGEVRQADITYVTTKEGWLHVAGVLDACSRRIVGWAADDAMPTGLVARAFEREVQAQRPAPGCSTTRTAAASMPGCVPRTAALPRRGPEHEPCGQLLLQRKMESFWATLKTELIDGQVYSTRAEDRRAIFSYIEVFYKRVWLHGALGFYSPWTSSTT